MINDIADVRLDTTVFDNDKTHTHTHTQTLHNLCL